MPELTITTVQRAAIYPQIRRHLTTIDRVRELAETDPKEAQLVAMEFAVWFAFLGDLGWDEEDDRESIRLTVPASDLRPALELLLAESVTWLREAGEVEGARDAFRALLDELDAEAPREEATYPAP
jgi:hypothetical protein